MNKGLFDGVWATPEGPRPKLGPADSKEDWKERKPRMRAAVDIFSNKYVYRRAFSELTMLDLMDGYELKEGTVMNFLTGGNIDQMTYLKVMVRKGGRISHCIISTWCLAADDARQLIDLMEDGAIGVLDLYVGEIFKGSYRAVWNQLHDYYLEHPDKGRICIFRNHSKVIAGKAEHFSFYVQTSANMDTNPRTEQGCIQIGERGYGFISDYFNGIVSFEKEDRNGR